MTSRPRAIIKGGKDLHQFLLVIAQGADACRHHDPAHELTISDTARPADPPTFEFPAFDLRNVLRIRLSVLRPSGIRLRLWDRVDPGPAPRAGSSSGSVCCRYSRICSSVNGNSTSAR